MPGSVNWLGCTCCRRRRLQSAVFMQRIVFQWHDRVVVALLKDGRLSGALRGSMHVAGRRAGICHYHCCLSPAAKKGLL